jgi:hypothetical protein
MKGFQRACRPFGRRRLPSTSIVQQEDAMRMRWLGVIWLAAGLLVLGGAVPSRAQKDPTRDVFLQSIGLLAGQGLVLGHESLGGIMMRYDRKLLTRDKALATLIIIRRYTDLVLQDFSGRLMAQLTGEEKKDLTLLMGFYEDQRQAIVALAEYVRVGGAANRQTFEENQTRVAAIIRQISLAGPRP